MTNFAPYFNDMWLPPNKISAMIIILSLAAGLLSTSCSKKQAQEDILPQDKLVNIMIEFYLAESRLGKLSITQDSARKLFVPFEESVLKKYDVSDSALSRTYQYYFDHPTEMEKIYEVVLDSLSLRERKATSVLPTVK
jgi:Domain of unknown function (DUF4296)